MPEEKKPVEEKTKIETEIPEEKKQSSEEKPMEQPTEEKAKDEAVEETSKETKVEETAPPELSEEDKLKEENFRLKTQLEAMKVGFNPDCIEDAVVLAENIVKRDGSDIATALQSVAKKYPDWKTDGKGSKVGFKIGADRNADESKATEDRLNEAFGIKKRKD